MNPILKQLKERKSVRIFTDEEVTDKERDIILQAAIDAPTACNQNLSTIIDIKNQDIKETIAKAAANQKFVKDAPMVTIFTADWNRYLKYYNDLDFDPREPDLGDFTLAFQDALIAAHNSVIAAESIGLGTCYIGMIVQEYELVREALSLPKYVVPAIMVVYGHPKESQLAIDKRPRFDKDYIVHTDTYKDLSEQDMIDMHNEKFKDTDAYDFDEFIAKHYESKYETFGKDMAIAAKKYISDFDN